MKTALPFYKDNCNFFNVTGMPNMRRKENKEKYGPNGLNIKAIQMTAVEELLKRK
jgi:hypothetical protein